MQFALVKEGKVEKYPLSSHDLLEIGLANGIELDSLEKKESVGVVGVYSVEVNREWNKNYTVGDPVFVNGNWFESWNESSKSQEEIDGIVSRKWEKVRKQRNELLGESDWTQLADCQLEPAKVQEWAVYRQQLRDITEQPDPFDIWFPAEPEA
jgi:hypothetical protein